MKEISKKIIYSILIIIICGSCGYHFAGGGNLPQNIRSIHIRTLKNNSFEAGLESVLTNAMINVFSRNRKDVLKGEDTAEAQLTGIIQSVSLKTVSLADANISDTGSVTINVDLKLVHMESLKVIWSVKGLTQKGEYDIEQGSKLVTEQNRREAIKELANKIAEKIFYSMTDDF